MYTDMVRRLTLSDQRRHFLIQFSEFFLREADSGAGFRERCPVLLLGFGGLVKLFLKVAVIDETASVTDASSLLPAGTDNRLKIRTMLVAHGAIPAQGMLLRGRAERTDRRLFAGELVFAVVVVASIEPGPPYNGVRFDFFGYGGRIFPKRLCNAGIAPFEVQQILYDLSLFSGQVFVLFHSRYLLKPRCSRKRIA